MKVGSGIEEDKERSGRGVMQGRKVEKEGGDGMMNLERV